MEFGHARGNFCHERAQGAQTRRSLDPILTANHAKYANGRGCGLTGVNSCANIAKPCAAWHKERARESVFG
jgi:hypothetical protein